MEMVGKVLYFNGGRLVKKIVFGLVAVAARLVTPAGSLYVD